MIVRGATGIGLAASALLLVHTFFTQPLAAQTAGVHCSASTLAVEGVHDHGTDYARLMELAGAAPLRSWMIVQPRHQRRVPYCAPLAATPWDASLRLGRIAQPRAFELLPAGAVFHHNSAYARSGNDGPLWAGRGASAGVHAGVHGGWGPLSFAFAPFAAYQQNADFTIQPEGTHRLSPWGYAREIDWPQRHGPDPFWTLDPGQSHLAVRGYGAEAGFTTENLWLGPGRRNALVMTSAGPGVPRFFAGTDGPVDVRIGTLEANFYWGQIRESAWFDDDPDNDRNLLGGLALVFQPRPFPGLFLGLARSYISTWPAEPDPFELLARPYRDLMANPAEGELQDNNLIGLFMRWALPQAGFEVYAEWGREDAWYDWLDVLAEPDHSQAYVLGFQKIQPFGQRWLRIAGELTHLHSAAPIRGGRGTGGWYTHSGIRQGYTHRGQLLGAAIGPGSDAQFLGADLFDTRGRSGLSIERIRYDEDRYYQRWGRVYGMHGHDVEVTGSLSRDLLWGDFDLGGELGYSWRRNRNFIGLESGEWGNFRTETNLGARLRVVWRP
jgi:hypothetical protein